MLPTPSEAAPAIGSISLSIATLRGQRVMIDSDLAALCGVETKRFNEAIKRNAARFPVDFMFQLTQEEAVSLRSQFATLKPERGQHRKYAPYVFTELEERTERIELNHGAFSSSARHQLKQVIETLKALTMPPDPPKRPIGFITSPDSPKTKLN